MQNSGHGYPVKGLTQKEVHERRIRGLVNESPDTHTKSNWEIIRDHVFTLFNLFNVLIGAALALVGAWANMLYLGVIFLNIVIGVFQQWYAKKLVEKLSLLSESKAQVIREGDAHIIPLDELVLDDVCILEVGGQVCADSQVLYGEIEVNESLLTGEADPITKKPGDELLSGSFVVSGRCCAEVRHVGRDNFVNKIAEGAKKRRGVKSELVKAMGKVTKFTGYFILPVGILLFVQAHWFRADPIFTSVVSTAAALLGMLPKGLILLISISLATGVIALSKRKVLVQDLYCIETLAHVDMLCLDKTGTITKGEMQVEDICWIGEPKEIDGQAALRSYLAVCEDSSATILALKKYVSSFCDWEPASKISFSSSRKWGSVSFIGRGTFVLGAPEMILRDKAALPKTMQQAINDGERVLCFGYTATDLAPDMFPEVTPLAFIRISDPVREDAAETIAFFKKEGVAVKIISGDNPATVSNVAKKAGVDGCERYIDLSTLTTDEAIDEAAGKYTIFGRVLPAQKSRLLKALQDKGHTVAMTGDGVNDVLALRQADCGIAIGSGSDAARQVSGIVLTASDFSALPHILYEGRRVVNNITRVASLFFIKTLYSAFLSVLCLFTATPFPFVPIQITLIDALLEALPSFSLSMEPDHRKITGAFLPTVIVRAFPYALLIFINHLVLVWGLPLMGITEFSDGTVLYYLSGFIYILALIRSCRPMNILRMLLCALCSSGFYFCAVLFAPIFYLERASVENFGLFAILALLSIPVMRFVTGWVGKIKLPK